MSDENLFETINLREVTRILAVVISAIAVALASHYADKSNVEFQDNGTVIGAHHAGSMLD